MSPEAAPYCYTASSDLEEFELGGPTAGEEGSFRTSYGFGSNDYVEVQAYVVDSDTDELTDEQIVSDLAIVIADVEAGGFDFEAEPTSFEVDGARAFVYQGTSFSGNLSIDTHFVFRGRNEVQVNCASVDEAEAIDAACSEVLDSMQIIG